MLTDFSLLDWILILILLAYFVSGYARGFFLTLGSVVGFVLGAVAAFYVTPWLVERAEGGWRIVVAIVSIGILILIGQALGVAIGRPLRRITERTGLGIVDRIGGALLNTLTCAFVIVVLSFSASQLGVAAISSAVNKSTVITGLQSATPQPVQRGIAEARAAVLEQSGIPRLDERLFPQEAAPTETSDSDSLRAAEDSVLKINGTAEACAQSQSGSGFVAASHKVITNAHVVSGVDSPLVQTRQGKSYEGNIVYFDADKDIAVLDVPGLDASPLKAGENGKAGDLANFMGYPLGGPFTSRSASIQGLGYNSTTSENGTTTQPREIYQLAADVQQGNSGGPLLNDQGQFIGLIFAKATQGETGYALSMTELEPVLQDIESMNQPVPSGECTSG